TNDIEMDVGSSATKEKSMICMEEHEEGVMNMPEYFRDVALMSPTHSFGYHGYEDIHVEDFQDEEVSLWNF
ncbi:putative DRE-binding protein DREB1, partial [Trifolium medium]|nr:putative DRE-binding protein DREB1 [Trifolium medium]